MHQEDTIVAVSTPMGIGAIGLIRLSGKEAISIIQKVFDGRNLKEQASHTLHFGRIHQGGRILDEVIIGLYKGPNSYTGQNVVEISCHGSPYIIQSLLDLLIEMGARPADPGEFTLRAFLNGKMDLSQSEAVADLITSETASMHQVAMQQLRGGFKNDLEKIRQELLDFASLLELELDFSEEDVEFADRNHLTELLNRIQEEINPLIQSFSLGNALKKGVPVVIAGKPNAGKSTLLNSLLNENRALVSNIPGTTRDTIEVELNLNGILFRLIDTAGLRASIDEVEKMGIQKTYEEMEKAQILIYLFDPEEIQAKELDYETQKLKDSYPETQILLVANKSDMEKEKTRIYPNQEILSISAKEKLNLNALKAELVNRVDQNRLLSGSTIITNSRHLNALKKTLEAVNATLQLLKTKNSGELLAFEIKEALYHLGLITGQVSNDELLGNIFGRFCIGK